MFRKVAAVVAVLSIPSALRAQDAALVRPYTATECPSCAEWNEPKSAVHLFGNTYDVGTRGLAAILITSEDGHVLIDGGLPDSAPLILANIRALGVEPSEVKYLLNAHAHYDHAGGIAALQQATGARVLASEHSAPVLRSGMPGRNDPLLRQPGLSDGGPGLRARTCAPRAYRVRRPDHAAPCGFGAVGARAPHPRRPHRSWRVRPLRGFGSPAAPDPSGARATREVTG